MKTTTTRNPAGLEGLDTLIKNLRDFQKEIYGQKGFGQNPVRSAVRVGAKDMAERIRQAAPKDTGNMADSIQAKIISVRERDKFTSRGDSLEAFDIGATKSGFYASLVELGTSRSPAQPFMRPTLLSNEGQFYRLFKNDLTRRVDLIAKKLERRAIADSSKG